MNKAKERFLWSESDIEWIDADVQRGGPGSGHHDHAGRPGEVGGSVPSSGQGVAEGEAPYGTEGKKRIVRIISVRDTRDYDDSSGEWKPIPGSGEEHYCDRCGKVHEIHATVELEDESYINVGTACARAEFDEQLKKRMSSKVRAAKRLRVLELEMAEKKKKQQEWDSALAEVRGLSHPEVTFEEDESFQGRPLKKARMADAVIHFSIQDTFNDERRKTLINSWQMKRMNELGFGSVRPHFDKVKYEKDIARTLATLEAGNVIERGGPGSGHHEHAGRPGEVGGSLPSGAVGTKPSPKSGGRVAEADATYVDEDEYRPTLDDFATWADTDALVWIDADNEDGTFNIEVISGVDRGASYDNILAEDLWESDRDEIHLWIDKGPDESIGRAIETFGLTEDLRESGYILPDGTMLNFSGSNEGGPAGMRSLDHRDIGRILLEEEPGGTEGMVYFMDQTGAIRMNWSDGDLSVDFSQTPTSDQKEALEYLVAQSEFLAWDYTIYDAVANDFRTVESRQMGDPTIDDLRQVYRDIKSADMRERSMLHRIFNMLSALVNRGGAGSGHYDHEGRPGEVGGSLPSGAAGAPTGQVGTGVREAEAVYTQGDAIGASEVPELAYGDKSKVQKSLAALKNYVQNIARGERGERGQPGDDKLVRMLWELERQQRRAVDEGTGLKQHTYRRSWRAFHIINDWIEREGIDIESESAREALAILEPFANEYDPVIQGQINDRLFGIEDRYGEERRQLTEDYMSDAGGDVWRRHQVLLALGSGIGSYGVPALDFAEGVVPRDTPKGFDPRELMDDLIIGGKVFTDQTKEAVFKAWLARAQTPGTGEWGFAKGIEAETGWNAEAFAFDAMAHSSEDRWVPSDESSQLWATAQLLNDGWQRSTQTPGGMLITEIASEIWGGEPIDRDRSRSSAGKLSEIDEPAVRAEATSVLESAYEKTQALFREWGMEEGDTIRLFRGMNNAKDERWNPDGRFGAAEVDMWSASSWSSDLRSAHLFAKNSDNGAIVVANVPIEQILTTWYTGFPAKGEREYIVLGLDGIDSKVYHKNEGAFTIESYADPSRFKTFEDLVARAKGPWRFHIDRVDADWLRDYRKRLVRRGGPGSGHHGHEGRPGEVGGSAPSGASKPRKIGGGRVSEAAPVYGIKPSSQQAADMMGRTYGVADNIALAAWIGPDGEGLAPKKDHQITAKDVLEKLGMPPDTYRNSITATVNMIDLGLIRYTRFQDIHGFTVPRKKITDAQKEAIVTIMARARGKRSGLNFLFDRAVVEPQQEHRYLERLDGRQVVDMLDLNTDFWEVTPTTIRAVYRGGPGSGHHEHAGRPGEVGGSAPSGATVELDRYKSIRTDRKAHRFLEQYINDRPGTKKVSVGFETVSGMGDKKGLVFTRTDGPQVRVDLVEGEFGNNPAEIVVFGLWSSEPGAGLGTAVMYGLREYVKAKGKRLSVEVVANNRFFRRFNWLEETDVGNFIYDPKKTVERGGPGSGHFGHKGRPGEVGGSAPGTGFNMKAGGRTFLDKSEAMEWTAEQMRKLPYEVSYLFSDAGKIFEHSSINPTRISYNAQDLAAMTELRNRPENTGLISIHNHPSVDLKADYPPSFSDFNFAMKQEMDEWWVITSNGKYVVKRGEAGKPYYAGSDPYILETAWNEWVATNSDDYFAGILKADPDQSYFHLATSSKEGADKYTAMRRDLIQDVNEYTNWFNMEWVPNE